MAYYQCGGKPVSFIAYESISGSRDDATVGTICEGRSDFSVDVEVEYSLSASYGSSSSAAYAILYCGDEIIWRKDKFGGSVSTSGTCVLPAGKKMSVTAYRTGSSTVSASCNLIYKYNY